MTSSARRLPATRLCTALLTVGLLLGPVAWAPASAEAPVDVAGPVTDRAGVLSDDEVRDVEDRFDTFYDDTQRQIFVVYVDSFEGTDGAAWADETALESGLGSADLLLAVATQQRSYGLSVPDDVSDADLEKVDREFVLPALRRNDWAGAATAAADGFTETEQGLDVPWTPIALGGAALLAAGAYAVHRTRRRYDHTHRVRDEHGNPVDPATILTDAELDQDASSSLVAIDDTLRLSEQELGFAEAQFGTEATQRFRAVIEEGRAKVREAFTLRQRLDDAEPESDAERRTMASRIIAICEEVDATLDAQVDDFDRMRDIEGNAAQVLDDVAAGVAAAHSELPAATERLERLRSAHDPAVIAPVLENVADAETLLGAAHEAVGNARADLPSDTGAAAVAIRSAESATSRARALIAAVTDLESALQRGRDAADELAGRVGARVEAVTAFVDAHRAAVGSDARTRLSEAARLVASARADLTTDPPGAQATLQRAETLVAEAQQSADADVARWRADAERAEQRRDRRGSSSGADSLLLGGILLGDRSSGSSRRRRGSASRRTTSSFGGSSKRTRRAGSSTRRSSGGSTRRRRGGRF